MLNLAFDTSTKQGRFALAEDDELLVYRPLNVGGSYADALLPVIEEMLAEVGRKKHDLDAIGITIGPGSFTGVRIGVATAKGLAWGLGCRLVGVTSIEAMAGALLVEHPDAEIAVPVLDARRGEIFAGLFERSGGWVKPVVPAAAMTPDHWWAKIISTVEDPNAPVYGGDGTSLLLGQADTLRAELQEAPMPVLRRWSTNHPATAPALAIALGTASMPETHPFALLPEYMRVSDAEVKRRLDLTPSEPGQEITTHHSQRPGHE
ncbi:MAG: tRNA threonylcarbamoyladenosine biosynthesis protein TsaB [Candidatus Krumholzibacteriia bacterium]|jgi:tRNA threonylcarbamoyladenosine biosynthesis protein TsaB